MNQVDSVNNMLRYLDIVMIVASIGIGVFTLINPRKSWELFQSKKIKKETIPDDRTIKNTRIFGGLVLILAIAFIFVVLFE
ncbi:MAG: hypothetical protein H7X94_00080 [Vallitaleaceae bacterium]|nr:hypothetical protein [Vallitaleaceae bacterium]